MAAESNQMIRTASSLDRNSQRDLDVEAFAGGSRYRGADGTPLYPVQSTQINIGYENPPPRYSVRSPQRPQRVYGNHPFRHSTNSHDEENTPVQHISGSLRTRASDNNVTRRPEPAELQPTVADATKALPASPSSSTPRSLARASSPWSPPGTTKATSIGTPLARSGRSRSFSSSLVS